MGCVDTITATTFPRQSNALGQRVKVMFHYARPTFDGVIIRDDAEEPWLTLIALDEAYGHRGAIVRGSECQYTA